jgi:hypothetical protein
MYYDCHLQVCSLTNPDRVDQHLRRRKPPGVVFVQKGADPRSRNEWMSRLGLGRGACGVALINGHDLSLGFDRLQAHGTFGALVRLTGSDTRARAQDQIQHLHGVLPRTSEVPPRCARTVRADHSVVVRHGQRLSQADRPLVGRRHPLHEQAGVPSYPGQGGDGQWSAPGRRRLLVVR